MVHARSARRVYACALVVVALCSVAARRANAAAAEDPARPVQSVSANPFTLMFTWFNADYERRFAPNVTWDASGSFFSIDEFAYKNVNVAIKYYPRAAMSGFYVGGRTGIYHVSANLAGANFYGAGFEVGYNWLLGKGDHFVVGTGAGVTRLFGGQLTGATLTVPTVRLLNIGYAF